MHPVRVRLVFFFSFFFQGVTDPDVCCNDGRAPSFMLHTLSQQGGKLAPGTRPWNMAAMNTVNASLFEWLRTYF